MFFGLCAALMAVGAAWALKDGDVAETLLALLMSLLIFPGAYAFAKADRSAVVICRRDGRHLRIITSSEVCESVAAEAELFVCKVFPRTQHLPHHEVRLSVPQRRDPIVLVGSLVASRAQRRAEVLAAQLGLTNQGSNLEG